MKRRRMAVQDLYNDNERLQTENKQLRSGYNFTNTMLADDNQILRTPLSKIAENDSEPLAQRLAVTALRDVGRNNP